jgi:hypothetical protein
MIHRGDLLAAQFLYVFPDADEVALGLDDWTTVETGPYGVLDLRTPRNGVDPLDPTRSSSAFGGTSSVHAGVAA